MSDDWDWKRKHANDSEMAVSHPLVKAVIAEQLRNLRREDDLLADYGLHKIAFVTAQVARAYALGFNPDLLRLSAGEANSQLLQLAAEAVYRGVPTIVVDDSSAI